MTRPILKSTNRLALRPYSFERELSSLSNEYGLSARRFDRNSILVLCKRRRYPDLITSHIGPVLPRAVDKYFAKFHETGINR